MNSNTPFFNNLDKLEVQSNSKFNERRKPFLHHHLQWPHLFQSWHSYQLCNSFKIV